MNPLHHWRYLAAAVVGIGLIVGAAGSNKSRPCVILYDLLAVPVAYTLRPAVSVHVVRAGQGHLITN